MKVFPKVKHTKHRSLLFLLGLAATVLFSLWSTTKTEAATMFIDPATGQYQVGDTFQVSILLDTENQEINTIEASLLFPADKLQIVSPTAGSSIINIYTTPPRFNNLTGRIDVAGGIPGGVKTGKGLITTITFKARASGSTNIRFLDNSKALLNDGRGTDALNSSRGANYQLILPPPAGPKVKSETHPDQEKWYNNPSAILSWEKEEGVTGYSYEVNNEPISLPDNVVDSKDNSIIYKRLGDGVYYFHIKSFRNGVWGGVTHFEIKVDTAPPAQFPIDIYPSKRTDSNKPVIEFLTTDQSSGIDRYEIKIVSLQADNQNDTFFIQTNSPYTPERLENGNYSIIVRAYDRAGNYQEVTERLEIVPGIGRFFSLTGLFLGRAGTYRWTTILPLLLLLVLVLLLGAIMAHKRHKRLPIESKLPDNVATQLMELQKYREKYGKLALLVIFIIASLLNFPTQASHAADVQTSSETLAAPIISSLSEKINDEEIFYISGRTSEPGTAVSLHLQKVSDGQTFEFKTVSDKRGDWFYKHNSFLSPGQYILWAQSFRGQEQSPPSGQKGIDVRPVAFKLAGSRITYQAVYMGIITLLLFLIFMLAVYLILIIRASKKQRALLSKELSRSEESIRQGFMALKNDLQLELSLIHKAGLSGELAGEEKVREEQIMTDLENIEKFVASEIAETKAVEGLG